MELVEVHERLIYGLSFRTNNSLEMNPATGQIGPLVQRFDSEVLVDYRAGARVYSVYSSYEAELSGGYSVLVGADSVAATKVPLEQVTIPAGRYLKFSAQGAVPQIVIATWQQIWAYFAAPESVYSRSFTTDFEFYPHQSEVEIFIAIR
jgi:predicted transcriptional regulator YdeE